MSELQIVKGHPDDDELAALVVALDIVRARNAEIAAAELAAAELVAGAGVAGPSRWRTALAPRPWHRPATWAVASRPLRRK